MRYPFFLFTAVLFMSCDFTAFTEKGTPKDTTSLALNGSDAINSTPIKDSIRDDGTIMQDTAALPPSETIDTKQVNPEELVRFAETLIGTPYQYASTDPKVGFDCSGFITYVFNHFGVAVPRSSVDFTNVGREIPVDSVRRGDLILFTGTDSTEELVGHMGIIVSGKDSVKFIHATSGKAYGVTITPLNKYYLSRFVKTIRIFPG
jgi:cell wall-associated NlpC family hydrolase